VATGGSGKLTRRGGERRSSTPLAVSDVGASLRDARERLGLSLAEVRDRTGVSWQHLEALEAMDLGRLPDQRTVVTAARRYSEVVGLDPSEICGTVLRAWQDEHWMQSVIAQPPMQDPPTQTGGRSRRKQANVASSPEAPSTNGGTPAAAPWFGGAGGTTGSQPHLRAFTQTAEVPMLGGARSQRSGSGSLHFAETGALPVTSRFYGGRRLPPRWLRVSVALTALLLLIGLGGLAVHHYKPQWLADIHVVRGNPAGSESTSGSTPRPGPSTNGQAGHTTRPPAPKSHALVTLAGVASTSSVTVAVHASGYQVLISLQRACWVDVTDPSGGSAPVFVGVLPAGTIKTFSPVGGKLSIEFGASGVTVAVKASGKSTPGWTFSPQSAPFTLGFVQASGT